MYRNVVGSLLILLTGLLLGGCSGWAPVDDRSEGDQDIPAYHLVQRGENLFRIAWRYGLDFRDVARWNRLASPDRILAGQRLRLSPPGSTGTALAAKSRPASKTPVAAAPPPTPTRPTPPPQQTPVVASSKGAWEWPAQGSLLKSYNPSVPGGKGIQIGGRPGQGIKAASSGRIVYKGSGLRGYGRLIIVKHSDSLLSAYGYLGRIFVEEGDKVSKGQVIAEMDNGSGSQPSLHFEIRKDGRPVNPLQFLPS